MLGSNGEESPARRVVGRWEKGLRGGANGVVRVIHPGAHGINFFCRFLGRLSLTAGFTDSADTTGGFTIRITII